MEDAFTEPDRRAIWLAWGVIAGVVVFNIGWVVSGALQRGGYSIASDDATSPR
jgi:hypothetical protein